MLTGRVVASGEHELQNGSNAPVTPVGELEVRARERGVLILRVSTHFAETHLDHEYAFVVAEPGEPPYLPLREAAAVRLEKSVVTRGGEQGLELTNQGEVVAIGVFAYGAVSQPGLSITPNLISIFPGETRFLTLTGWSGELSIGDIELEWQNVATR